MGLGDEIMTTAIAKRLHASYPDCKLVVGDGRAEVHSEVFENNPHISSLSDVHPGDQIIWIHDYPGRRPYVNEELSNSTHRIFTDYQATPGELYFHRNEEKTARDLLNGLENFIVIEPNIKGTWFGRNKDWGWEKWEKLVSRINHRMTLVQLGAPSEKSLPGIRRIHTPNFRLACAILSFSKGLISPEGGLHHAAAALGKPAVVLFGGLISPDTTGYNFHTNIYPDHPDSPCGSLHDCAHCRECMELISVNTVEEAALGL